MSDPSDETIFDMPLEALRERTERVRQTIARMEAMVRPLLNPALPRELEAGESEAVSVNDFQLVLSGFNDALTLISTLLPGLVSLTPEHRMRLAATSSTQEDLRTLLNTLPVPPRASGAAPSPEERLLERVRDRMARSELLSAVGTALASLVENLESARQHINMRAGAPSRKPSGKMLN